MAKLPTARELTLALRTLSPLKGRQRFFLRAHFRAKGRALTMRRLAQAAKYRDYRGVNLQYGLIAARIGRALRRADGIKLLVQFVPPRHVAPTKNISNAEWILVMRPAFASALRRVKSWR